MHAFFSNIRIGFVMNCNPFNFCFVREKKQPYSHNISSKPLSIYDHTLTILRQYSHAPLAQGSEFVYSLCSKSDRGSSISEGMSIEIQFVKHNWMDSDRFRLNRWRSESVVSKKELKVFRFSGYSFYSNIEVRSVHGCITNSLYVFDFLRRQGLKHQTVCKGVQYEWKQHSPVWDI